jgi:RNA methyltransferase, TrmH family
MKASNKQLGVARSLGSRKGREESGLFAVEGTRLCEELFDSGAPVEFLLLSEYADSAARSVASDFEERGIPVLEAAAFEFEKVSDTVNSQGVLAAARWKELRWEALEFGKRAAVVALDGVGDPGNVGTVIRTAAWFGAEAVLLGRGCADLLNPKTVRATMGGMFHLPVCRDVPLAESLARLKGQEFAIGAATMDGSPDWSAWARPSRAALLLGNEAHGVAPELLKLADACYTIPRRGAGESLNVAVSAGIFLAAMQG